MPMEQQTMTGSGLYIFIAVQLLFSMLIPVSYTHLTLPTKA